MAILLVTDPRYLEHVTGPGHPERPARLGAVLDGAHHASVADALVPLEPRHASLDELARVHSRHHLDRLEATCRAGGGRLDPDTVVVPASWEAARLGAGAGLSAIEALDDGLAASAFCAVRPPGHHATATEAMGFCLVNNVAVAAAALAARGERVAVVDVDAHHGNGTQDIFWTSDQVLYVSIHQWPLYPGTGRVDERGGGAGTGFTCNIPVPPHTTGDVYLRAVDDLVAPLVSRFGATWLIVSAGFDGHAADPITNLGLAAADFGLLTERLLSLVPPGRRLVFLEGGYDLEALTASTASTLAAMEGLRWAPDRPSSGGPGAEHLADALRLWRSVIDRDL